MKTIGTEGFELIDIKQSNIEGEVLDRLKDEHGSYENLFNKRARKFRSECLHEQQLADEEIRDLILGEYTFLKRPVYIIGDRSFVGNSKKTVEEIQSAISE